MPFYFAQSYEYRDNAFAFNNKLNLHCIRNQILHCRMKPCNRLKVRMLRKQDRLNSINLKRYPAFFTS